MQSQFRFLIDKRLHKIWKCIFLSVNNLKTLDLGSYDTRLNRILKTPDNLYAFFDEK